ncbi:MAG: type II toxin-antitoxin system death-on-curing family toxin [Actinomycetota bacterium]
MLGAAAARPRTTAVGRDAYPDVWTKAAALLHSIVKHHPLVDGNKRLGWLACAVFLDLNGIDPTTATNDDVVEFVVSLAATDHEVDDLAGRLRSTVEGERAPD